MYNFAFTEECDQGDSFGLELELEGSDISECEIYSQIKDIDEVLYGEFTITKTDAVNGKFELELIDNTLPVGSYYSDILFIQDGRRRHEASFKLIIRRSVTNEPTEDQA